MLKRVIDWLVELTLWRVLSTLVDRQLERDAKNIERCLRRRALEETADFVMRHLWHTRSFPDRFCLLDHAISLANSNGDFAEFGVFRGDSINHISARTSQPVYGFDSFEGLPENWIFGYTKERFRLKGLPKVRRNVQLIKGWYDQTLPAFFAKHDRPLAFVHIDCDLYSSTKTVFDNIAPRLADDAVIVFDEFFNYPGWKDDGEYKAFMEFVDRNNIRFHYIGYTTNSACVAVKLGAEPAGAASGVMP